MLTQTVFLDGMLFHKFHFRIEISLRTNNDKRREKSLYWFARSTRVDIAKGKHHRPIAE
jgi:hypothetical protein